MSEFTAVIPGGILYPQGEVSFFRPPVNLAPEERVVDPRLARRVKSLQEGEFVLVRDEFSGINTHSTLAQFNELPELGQTRLESGHVVTFGQLVINSLLDPENTEFIAIKPLETYQKAAHEFAVSQYFNREDEDTRRLRTFVPLGFYGLAGGEPAVITRYEHSVKSYDNVFWNPEVDPSDPIQKEMIKKALARCALSLGILHAEGWIHVDAQAKNMFYDSQDGVIVADLEETHPFKYKSGEPDIDEVDEDIHKDLSTFLASLDRIHEAPAFVDVIEEFYAGVYSAVVSGPDSLVPDEARRSPAQVAELYDQVSQAAA
jgi:hypothetical protein